MGFCNLSWRVLFGWKKNWRGILQGQVSYEEQKTRENGENHWWGRVRVRAKRSNQHRNLIKRKSLLWSEPLSLFLFFFFCLVLFFLEPFRFFVFWFSFLFLIFFLTTSPTISLSFSLLRATQTQLSLSSTLRQKNNFLFYFLFFLKRKTTIVEKAEPPYPQSHTSSAGISFSACSPSLFIYLLFFIFYFLDFNIRYFS